MNTDMKEQLSALMDGEVDRNALRFALRAADADPALRATWSRYHAARDVLRREPAMFAADGFADSLMARLDAEDAQVADRRGGTIGRWVRYASGGAVAAAVAVVALMASAPGTRQQMPQQAEALASSRTLPAAGDPKPATSIDVARAVNFTNDPIVMPSPLVQPVSATRSLPGYGYDPRLQQSSPWRHDGFGMQQRQGATPYVLVIVPQGAEAQQRPH
jgi:sigma-E factor negative regulatory protein RseA